MHSIRLIIQNKNTYLLSLSKHTTINRIAQLTLLPTTVQVKLLFSNMPSESIRGCAFTACWEVVSLLKSLENICAERSYEHCWMHLWRPVMSLNWCGILPLTSFIVDWKKLISFTGDGLVKKEKENEISKVKRKK